VGATVEIPYWLALLIGLLAFIALLDRILVPSARWYLRRRLDRAIDRLNERLQLRIQPIKIAKRQALIDQLIFDPEVLKAIEDHARDNNVSRAVAQAKALRYAREIVPSFSAYAYFGVGARLARWLSTFLYRVRLGFVDFDALRAADPDSSVIFVINHRSNMDYVLVTYMASQSSALSYAVGEWARVWLLQSLIRSMGAYFVRRDSGEPLYRKVLSRYVNLAVAGGLTQAMFPEGGLTRDGTLRPPKLGLLSYMVSGFDPHGARDAVFVPVGINYDRVIEDRIQTAAIATPEGEKPRFKFSPRILVKFLAHNVALKFHRHWYRYGYACVSFGLPISLRAYMSERNLDFRTMDAEHRFAAIAGLGEHLIEKVGAVIPVLPVSLVTTALLHGGDHKMSLLEIKTEVARLIAELKARGAHAHIPRADLDYAIEVGLRMLRLRHLVKEEDGLFSVNPDEVTLLRYYANSIAHLLSPAAIERPTVIAASET